MASLGGASAMAINYLKIKASPAIHLTRHTTTHTPKADLRANSYSSMENNQPTAKQPSLNDHFVYGVYRTFEFFFQLLPMEAVCVIGSALGQLAYFLMRKRRQVVVRNLRIVYGHQLPPAEINALARKTFRCSGCNLIASISASSLSSKDLTERVEIEGLDNLINAYSQDKGCILLAAHMGNWEILTQLHLLIPEIKSLASLYRPLNNPLIDRLVKRRRQRRGTQLFSRRDGFSKPIAHLKSKGTLGVIADQSAGKHGVPVPFFGKLSSMTNLPALLHRKTKAPIIPISMCTLSPGKWKVILHPAVAVTEDEMKDTYRITLQCASAYETLMQESPADVLWMHNYWRGGKRTALKVRGLSPRNIDRVGLHFTKSFYLLIYIDNTITDSQLTDTLIYLRACRPDLNITLIGRHTGFPNADHCLSMDAHDPPHLAVNALQKLENSLPAPFDCALDLSDDGSGAPLFKQADLPYTFTLSSPPDPVGNNPGPMASYQDRLKYFIERVSPPPPNK